MKKAEREAYLKARLEEMLQYERQLYAEGYGYIAGVDEVGRGPLAGPVVAAAVVLQQGFDVPGVDDSKKLSEKKREQLYEVIWDKALAIGIGSRDNLVIDEVNILEATKLAMIEAIDNAEKVLRERFGTGIDYVLFDAMKIDAVQKPQMSLIKGDAKSVSIAAASIIAKVTRDRQMGEWSKAYPDYAFEKNKGYGTKAHYEGLERCGLTPIHRKSFLKNFK